MKLLYHLVTVKYDAEQFPASWSRLWSLASAWDQIASTPAWSCWFLGDTLLGAPYGNLPLPACMCTNMYIHIITDQQHLKNNPAVQIDDVYCWLVLRYSEYIHISYMHLMIQLLRTCMHACISLEKYHVWHWNGTCYAWMIDSSI